MESYQSIRAMIKLVSALLIFAFKLQLRIMRKNRSELQSTANNEGAIFVDIYIN